MIEIDRVSLLVHASWDVTLAALERALNATGLTLRLTTMNAESTVRDFLQGDAHGAPSPWSDPADHLIAGLSAVETNGTRRIHMKPAPRRAVGPDLTALVLGQRGKYFELTSAWIRVHERAPENDWAKNRPGFHAPNAASGENESALTPDEAMLLDRVARELRAR